MRVALALVAVLLASSAAMTSRADAAATHRAGCHTAHTCPSDHATYRWGSKRLLCVKPTSDKRTARFKTRVRYGGYTYWCRR